MKEELRHVRERRHRPRLPGCNWERIERRSQRFSRRGTPITPVCVCAAATGKELKALCSADRSMYPSTSCNWERIERRGASRQLLVKTRRTPHAATGKELKDWGRATRARRGGLRAATGKELKEASLTSSARLGGTRCNWERIERGDYEQRVHSSF